LIAASPTYDEYSAAANRANEQLKEIETDHLRLLMVPYYEADTLYRIMDSRPERVKLAQTFYLEYLKLMNHY
jgi:hypothetical protein